MVASSWPAKIVLASGLVLTLTGLGDGATLAAELSGSAKIGLDVTEFVATGFAKVVAVVVAGDAGEKLVVDVVGDDGEKFVVGPAA